MQINDPPIKENKFILKINFGYFWKKSITGQCRKNGPIVNEPNLLIKFLFNTLNNT